MLLASSSVVSLVSPVSPGGAQGSRKSPRDATSAVHRARREAAYPPRRRGPGERACPRARSPTRGHSSTEGFRPALSAIGRGGSDPPARSPGRSPKRNFWSSRVRRSIRDDGVITARSSDAPSPWAFGPRERGRASTSISRRGRPLYLITATSTYPPRLLGRM